MNTPPPFESPTLPAPTSPPPAERKSRAATPATFRHYLLERRPDGSLWELGRGGMGVTYKAVDVNLHCPVALKIIGPQCFGGGGSRRRFIREARLAAQIRHPNVAAIYHLETEEEEVFYAMEYVDGITAEDWVRGRGPMRPELALDVAMQVARALTAADCLKLVHRDIKPSNIMLLPDPADRTRVIVKVIDFGLARSLAVETGATVTTCAFVGTPQFASPEQIENLKLDIRSDIYSLGCMLWYLLAGEAPFKGSAARVMAQQLTSHPPYERLSKVPKSVNSLLRTILAKSPAERPQTPVALHTSICQCRETLGRRIPETEPARSGIAERSWRIRSTIDALPWAASIGLFATVAWLCFAPRDGAKGPPHPISGHGLTTVAASPSTTLTAAEHGRDDRDGKISDVTPAPSGAPSGEEPDSLEGAAQLPATLASVQLATLPAQPPAFWAAPEINVPTRFKLRNDEPVALFTPEAQPADQDRSEAIASVPKPQSRTSKRKSASDDRKSVSSNPLQRARRSIQGFVNRLF